MFGRLKSIQLSHKSEPSSCEIQIAIEKLKWCKLSGIDKILTELVKTMGKRLCSEIHIIIKCSIKLTVVIIGNITVTNYIQNCIQLYSRLLRTITGNLNVTEGQQIRYSAFIRYWKK
jgi:hypothetical protein